MADKEKTEFHNCEDQEEVDSFLNKVESGDALEFRRTGFYNHWGICTGWNYAGEMEVVHVTAPEDTSILMTAMAACGCAALEKGGDSLANIGMPFKESLRYVMSKQSTVHVNNSIDNHILPFEVNIILARVNDTLQEGGWKCYHFALNNCEHYVNYCRNGNSVSLQSLQKGRLALGFLARATRGLARLAITPEMGHVVAVARNVLTTAQERLANRERQFGGQLAIEDNDGQNRIED